MNDRLDVWMICEGPLHLGLLTNVGGGDVQGACLRMSSEPRQVGVGAAAPEVVEADDFVTACKKACDGVAPDESGTTGDEYFHAKTLLAATQLNGERHRRSYSTSAVQV